MEDTRLDYLGGRFTNRAQFLEDYLKVKQTQMVYESHQYAYESKAIIPSNFPYRAILGIYSIDLICTRVSLLQQSVYSVPMLSSVVKI